MSASMPIATPEVFTKLIGTITARMHGRPLDDRLQKDLNTVFPVDGLDYQAIFRACRTGIAEGWMCNREASSIKFGRVIKPGEPTHNFSVDVVDMDSVAGPHHRHPNGEIDLIMPLTRGAKFDGYGAGWLVYGPGSAHHPAVTHGRALVLYLLPEGAIEFTRT